MAGAVPNTMERLLAERVHRQIERPREEIRAKIGELTEGLTISRVDVQFAADGWVQVSFGGEDEEAFEALLSSTFGFAKDNAYDIKSGEQVRGFLDEGRLSREAVSFDVGIMEPRRMFAAISLGALRASLCDGSSASIRDVMDALALGDGVALGLRVTAIDDENVNCWPSDSQVTTFNEWRSMPLQRLILVGASKRTVLDVLEKSHLTRDVARVESPSHFVQVISAKIGTQARGLIRPIGERLRDVRIFLFDPVRARKLLTGT